MSETVQERMEREKKVEGKTKATIGKQSALWRLPERLMLHIGDTSL